MATPDHVKLRLSEFDALRKIASGRHISEHLAQRLSELGLAEKKSNVLTLTGSGHHRLEAGF
jgi:hypothetical protein